MEENKGFHSLDSLNSILDMGIRTINNVIMTNKDIEALKWIVTFYGSKLNKIFGSDFIYFNFDDRATLELTVIEDNYEVKRMVWVAKNPLEVLKGITSRGSLRIDIRNMNTKVKHKEQVNIYLLKGDMALFQFKEEHHLLSYDSKRFDQRDTEMGLIETAEAFYLINETTKVKETIEEEIAVDKGEEIDLEWEEMEKQVINKNRR